MASTESEKAVLASMARAAEEGLLNERHYRPGLSVVIQQTFLLLYQHPAGLSTTELVNFLGGFVNREILVRILFHLEELWFLVRSSDEWRASTRLVDRGEKGKIHSNIPDTTMYSVVDMTAGREIGKVFGAVDSVFILARSVWRIVGNTSTKLHVVPFNGRADPALFERSSEVGAFWHLLPEDLRKLES